MALIFCGTPSSPRKGAIAIGTCVSPTPDTSTLNWAWLRCAKSNKEIPLRSCEKKRLFSMVFLIRNNPSILRDEGLII